MPGTKTRGGSAGRLSTIHPDAAGIDIGSTFHVVAVPSDRDDRSVRTFRTFSTDLHQLADWLTAVGITTVISFLCRRTRFWTKLRSPPL